MLTKQLIQASANVIRITKLVKGDVVKLFKDSNYGDKIKYAVVLDIVNDGEKTFVQFLVYNKSYSEVKGEILVLSGDDKDYSIFPTSKEELDIDFEQVIESIKRSISDDENKLLDKKEMLRRTEEFLSGEMARKLTTPEFNEMTQAEFNERKQIF